MALIERLCFDADPKIPVHAFFAAAEQRMASALTRQNVISMFALTAADLVDYDALVALFPAGTSAIAEAQKAKFIEKVHSVCILGEGRYAGYDTPELVRAKLGI